MLWFSLWRALAKVRADAPRCGKMDGARSRLLSWTTREGLYTPMHHLDDNTVRTLVLCLLLYLCAGCEHDAPSTTTKSDTSAQATTTTKINTAAATKGAQRWTSRRIIERDLRRAAKPGILQRKLENHSLINHHEWQEDGSVKVWAYGRRPPFIFTPDFKNRHPRVHKPDYESADIFGP